MRLVFRYDFGPTVGHGHKTRCELLIQASKRRGHSVVRLTNVSERAYDALTSQPAVDWIILDHYGYSDADILKLKQAFGAQVLVLDDHMSRQSADLRWAPFSDDAIEPTLRGEQYALIHPCFFNPSTHACKPFALACFGGADPKHLTQQLMTHLRTPHPGITHSMPWHILASQHMQAEQNLKDYVTTDSLKLIDPMTPAELARSFAQAQTVVVSASTLALEALAAKANLFAIEYTDNQSNIATWLRHRCVPVFHRITDLIDAITCQPPKPRRHTSINALALDDQGASRVIAALEAGLRIEITQE